MWLLVTNLAFYVVHRWGSVLLLMRPTRTPSLVAMMCVYNTYLLMGGDLYVGESSGVTTYLSIARKRWPSVDTVPKNDTTKYICKYIFDIEGALRSINSKPSNRRSLNRWWIDLGPLQTLDSDLGWCGTHNSILTPTQTSQQINAGHFIAVSTRHVGTRPTLSMSEVEEGLCKPSGRSECVRIRCCRPTRQYFHSALMKDKVISCPWSIKYDTTR